MQVIGAYWRRNSEDKWNHGLLTWGADRNSPSELPIVNGECLKWQIEGPKKCVGSTDVNGRAIPCPENSIVRHGQRKCGPCAALDVMDSCIRCDGTDCRAVAERAARCDSMDYVVYAAIFGEDTLKVGVSSKRRVETRWVEQGADFASIIAHIKSGRKARLLETTFGKSLSTTKQVRWERKASLLTKKNDPEIARGFYASFLEGSASSLLDSPDELVDLSMNYALPVLTAEPHLWRSRSKSAEGLYIIGEVVGMKGPLLITSEHSSYTVINVTDLIGYTINATDDINHISQTGLLDFM